MSTQPSTQNHQQDVGVDEAVFTPGTHTSVVRSVSIRVAGPVPTEAFAHHYGTTEQQVGVRAGDTLSYVANHDVAAAIARAFSDGVAVAERHELRFSVSSTWLGVEPGSYPPTLLQRHTTVPATSVGFQPRRSIGGAVTPLHVWVRVGPVLWQVCDRVAADRLAHVWSSCARLLAAPSPAPARRPRTATRTASAAAAAKPTPRSAREQGRTRAVTRVEAAADGRTDADLLAAYVAGDRDALAVLVVRRHSWITEAARRVLGARGDLDDVVQETWANVARTAHRFEHRAAVSTWLWRMAHNAALSVLRGQSVVVADTEDRPADGDAYRDTDNALTVRELLAVLPAPQRAAVELVDLQGRDIATAARMLQVPEGTVKSRCRRARDAMATEASRRDLAP